MPRRAGLPFFTFSDFLQDKLLRHTAPRRLPVAKSLQKDLPLARSLKHCDTRLNSHHGLFVLVVDFLPLKYSADDAIVTGGARGRGCQQPQSSVSPRIPTTHTAQGASVPCCDELAG
jgi:hypothetical protein